VGGGYTDELLRTVICSEWGEAERWENWEGEVGFVSFWVPLWDHWLYCGLTNHRSVIKGRLECEFGQLLGPLISELDSTLAFPTVKESTDDT